jgi:hypothetical protein
LINRIVAAEYRLSLRTVSLIGKKFKRKFANQLLKVAFFKKNFYGFKEKTLHKAGFFSEVKD